MTRTENTIQKIKIGLSILLFFLMFLAVGIRAKAEVNVSKLTTTSRQQDLTVSFTFDAGVVDITFISPSGVRITKDDEGVEYAAGEKWATYRIHDAQAGNWQVEYDFGANANIDYSIIKDNYGLWIQSFEIGDMMEDGRLSVSFQADCEDIAHYNYEIYATGEGDRGDDEKLAEGSASVNEVKEIALRVNHLSSGTYTLRLEIYGYDGDVELFDAANKGPFVYQNPEEPKAMDNFRLTIDQDHLTCTVDWSEFLEWFHKGYRLKVLQDGEVLSDDEYDRDIHAEKIYYTAGTKKLEFILSYQNGEIWSAERHKTITLGEEYLTKKTGEVSSSAQILIQYRKNGEGELFARVNDKEGTYRVTGEQEVAFPAQDGWNTIYAKMESDDLITYVIDDSIYYDAVPPGIILYDNLDGKSFTSEEVALIGKTEGGDVLLVNGEEAALNDKGEFTHYVKLNKGENVVELVVKDVNGNEAQAVLTLYRGESGDGKVTSVEQEDQPLWKKYLPLIISACISLVCIILALIFMKKQEKGKSRLMGNLILWDATVLVIEAVIAFFYYKKYSFGRSMDFFQLAEKSGTEAAQYIQQEAVLLKLTLIGAVVFGISVVITVICGIVRKKKKNKNEKADS